MPRHWVKRGMALLMFVRKKEDSWTWKCKASEAVLFSLSRKTRRPKIFPFLEVLKITETSQRVRVVRNNQCMGCTDILPHYQFSRIRFWWGLKDNLKK